MKLIAAIDKAYADTQESSFRTHLGASVMGHPCARKAWYTFRWARDKKHLGRMIRLFRRGHDEEDRFIEALQKIGVEIESADPETGEQFRFSDFNGHFGGSADSIIRNGEALGDLRVKGEGLAEFKTSGDKYFKRLQELGVTSAKLEHVVQMQLYMHYLGLSWGLYLSVNKNTDELYAEIVFYREEIAEKYREWANLIIEAIEAPPKVHPSGSWWMCKMCDFREICHQDKQPDKNCRSCVMARAVRDGKWYCTHHRSDIPEEFIREGCDNWTPIS